MMQWMILGKPKKGGSAVLIMLLLLIFICQVDAEHRHVQGGQQAMFIFGDSLSDVGNNNFILLSQYKANFPPNGIDYRRRIPTGRFCNGRLVLDILATLLGFPVPRAYLNPKTRGSALRQGVNYASAGCGILDETSNNSSGCLSLSTQLRLHNNTVRRLVAQIGADEAKEFLEKSVYFVAIGSNDFLGNFIMMNIGNSRLISPAEFISHLASVLENDIKILYEQNARRLVIIGLGPLGCIPSQRARDKHGDCNEELNSWVQSTNVAFQDLVRKVGAQFPDVLITFANPLNIARDFMQEPSNYGFKVTNEACCGGGKLNAQIPCLPTSGFCSNRKDHMFWDAWHPTEAVNNFVAKEFLSAQSSSVSPLSIEQVTFGQVK